MHHEIRKVVGNIVLAMLVACPIGGRAFVVVGGGKRFSSSFPISLSSNTMESEYLYSESLLHELYWLQSQNYNSKDDDDDDDLWLNDSTLSMIDYYNSENDNDHNDDDEEEGGESLGQSIGQGKVVACLPGIASEAECDILFQAAAAAAAAQQPLPNARGRSRFSVADPIPFLTSMNKSNGYDDDVDNDKITTARNIVLTTEEILLRVFDYLDDAIPSIYKWLFDPLQEDWAIRQPLNAALEQPTVDPDPFLGETCSTLRELYMQGALEWSEGEPAINIYQGGGYFGAHKDHLALTILIPLTSSESFQGGGTGFWAGNRLVDENPTTPPDLVLKPPRGSALVFGGDVTHAGMPVEAGIRSVLVCSFSTVTPASRPDRLQGLQAPPQVSANFKGTL